MPDATSEFKLNDAPEDCISSVKFGPNSSQFLLVSSWDETVRLYDVQSNSMRAKYKHDRAVLDCCFHVSSRLLCNIWRKSTVCLPCWSHDSGHTMSYWGYIMYSLTYIHVSGEPLWRNKHDDSRTSVKLHLALGCSFASFWSWSDI